VTSTTDAARNGLPPTADESGQPQQPARPLALSDFLDVRRLLEMQKSFAEVTHLSMTIRDEDGEPLSAPADGSQSFKQEDDLVIPLLPELDGDCGTRFTAPIVVEGQTLGTITIEGDSAKEFPESQRDKLAALALEHGVPGSELNQLIDAAVRMCAPDQNAAIQFLYLWANSLTRLCYQEYQLRRRVEELSALYELSQMLSAQRDLKQLLQTAAKSATEVMGLKAASIRLLSDDGRELLPMAEYNLSSDYMDKGPILVHNSELAQRSLRGEVVYVEDMTKDDRIVYNIDAAKEGLVSLLGTGMICKGRPIGSVRFYTDTRRVFSPEEIELLKAVAQLLAAAIENAQLQESRKDNIRIQRQLRLAGDVQRRMLPAAMPDFPPFDISARYEPSFDVGGDFFDFIDLDGNLGVAVGDVVGKGVAASLLMASVRGALRAYADDIYDLDEIISRVNVSMTRDTLDNEFATVFYGVLDPEIGRMTYCNAGHDPPLLLRNNEVIRLDSGGTVIGISAQSQYEKGVLDFHANDLLLIYTDGLPDAMNFDGERYGRERVIQSMREAADFGAHHAAGHVLWQMKRFVGLQQQTDDCTFVVIKIGDVPERTEIVEVGGDSI